jgi:uncharacterized protein (UPF0332 family)
VKDSHDRMARARRELAAARHLASGGFPVQAISRAYYAAFYAAEVALAELGETRSRHSGVVAAFGQLLVRPGTLDPAAGRLLRSLFERRARADYDEDDEPTGDDARTAIDDATRLVETIDGWLAQRTR